MHPLVSDFPLPRFGAPGVQLCMLESSRSSSTVSLNLLHQESYFLHALHSILVSAWSHFSGGASGRVSVGGTRAGFFTICLVRLHWCCLSGNAGSWGRVYVQERAPGPKFRQTPSLSAQTLVQFSPALSSMFGSYLSQYCTGKHDLSCYSKPSFWASSDTTSYTGSTSLCCVECSILLHSKSLPSPNCSLSAYKWE